MSPAPQNPTAWHSIKIIVAGLLWIAGAVWYLTYETGSPHLWNELSLIRRGQVANGLVTEAHEDVEDDDTGRSRFFHGATYTYRLPDGREFVAQTRTYSGRLSEDLKIPFQVEVEYLSDDPSISRVKGTGNTTVFEWLWRGVGLGSLLLAMLTAPGIFLLKQGVLETRSTLRHAILVQRVKREFRGFKEKN